MPRVFDTPEGGVPPLDFNAFYRSFKRVWEQTARVINGGISFGAGTTKDNIDGAWVAVANTGAANTNFTVTHNLGRVPVGYLVMTKDRAVDVYTGTIAATNTQLTLKASVANAVVTLFIL
jgi:hypothetical protein